MRKRLLAVLLVAVAGVTAYWALPVQQMDRSSANNVSGTPDLVSVLSDIPDEGFEQPSPDWKLTLPEDHGTHETARTETWQVQTHLRDEEGNALGFQFLFLRVGIADPTTPREAIWDVRDLERVHVALLDANAASVVHEERLGRGMAGLSGFDEEAGELRMDNWFLRFGPDGDRAALTLHATIGNQAVVKLVMRPEKPTVALEPNGADTPFVGYSMTRLAVEGTVEQESGRKAVSGTAWFDHLWGELPVPGAGPVAWDRFQLQLEDGVEISGVRSRRVDGRGAATVSAAIFEADGEVISLGEGAVQMTASRTWQSPSTGVDYPIEWQLRGPELDISIEPLFDAQVLDFSAPLWSGLVRVEGTRAETPVSGIGTLQLTGYQQ